MSTPGATLRATFDEGERDQASGGPHSPAFAAGEDPARPHYWIGFYRSVARQAIERVEELERALAATGSKS